MQATFAIAQYFSYNIGLLITANVIGLAGLFALMRSTQAKSTYTPFEMFLYGTTLGFSAIITVLFFLALAGILTKIVIFSSLGLIALFSCIYLASNAGSIRQVVQQPYQDSFHFNIYYVSLAGTIFIALLNLLATVSVTSTCDGTAYHLPYAQFYLDNHGLAVDTRLRYPFQAHNGNLLYSLALTFSNSIYCQTLHSLFGILTALAIFELALTASIAAPLAMLAAIGFLSLDIFHYLAAKANVDLFMGFFTTVSILALIKSQARNDQILFMLSAVFLGMTMGTKYFGALHALPIAVFILYQTHSFRRLFQYACIAAMFGLWWYVRSWILSGNPIHPFAAEIFGYYLWDKQDYHQHMQDYSGFVDKNLVNFLTLPALFNQKPFAFTGLQYWMYGFYLAPLCWFWLSSTSRALMLFTWPFLVFWFLTTQEWRYITPFAPFALVICLDLVQIVINQITRLLLKIQQFDLYSESLQIIIIGLLLGFVAKQTNLNIGILKLTLYEAITPEAERVFLKRQDKVYALIDAANQHFGKDQNLFLFDNFNKTYFVKAHVYGERYGEYRVRDFSNLIITKTTEPENTSLQPLIDKFAASHIDGFIITNETPYREDLFNQNFQLLFHNASGAVYQIGKDAR